MLAASVPVWDAASGWTDAHEQSYARFVETLFSGAGDASWPHLHALLRDADRNVLYDPSQDDRLTLRPDCGDLACVLRAYYAWKHALPFRYSACSRASAPECRVAGDQAMARAELGTNDDDESFARFIEQRVMTTVHSSSGRTLPDAELSDFYPPLVPRTLTTAFLAGLLRWPGPRRILATGCDRPGNAAAWSLRAI